MKILGQTQMPAPPVQELAGAKPEELAEVRKVAKGFESIFVNQLIGAMRKTVVKGGLVPESNAERTYQAMLDQEYAQKVSDSGQLGIAQMVYDQLLRKTQGQ